MGHHRRPDDPDDEQEGVGRDGRPEPVEDAAGVDLDAQDQDRERRDDDRHEPGDQDLEAAVAPLLDRQHHDRGRLRSRSRRRSRTSRTGGAGRSPRRGTRPGRSRSPRARPGPTGTTRTRAGIAVAADLGQAPAGDQAELARQVLDEDRHQVGGDDHPDEGVAEARAGRDVGREVARVDVRDRGDEAGAEESRSGPRKRPRARIASSVSAAAVVRAPIIAESVAAALGNPERTARSGRAVGDAPGPGISAKIAGGGGPRDPALGPIRFRRPLVR